MFASVFREAAARALLLPRRRPGQRTPLWQQRQRSADLLAEASKFPDFPILLEATRECLRDVFDVPALREVMADLRSRRTRLVAVDTEHASPFAQSLLFRWVGVYMYEGDAPLAERRAAALTLDRDLLRELLGSEELRELLDPRALDEVEAELQRLGEGRGARSADHLHDLLRTLGDLTDGRDRRARRERAMRAAFIEQLVADGRAIRDPGRRATSASRRSRTPPDSATRWGSRSRSVCPAAFTGETDRPLEGLVRRYARTHGPFVAEEVAARLGASIERVRDALAALEASEAVIRGEFRPGGSGREWCDPDVLRRLRRRSLALLRREVEPVDAAALGRFLPAWQGADRPARRRRRARRRDRRGSRARPCPRRSSRPTSFPAGSAGIARRTSTRSWRAATWRGSARGRSRTDDGRVTLVFRSDAADVAPGPLPPSRRRARCTTRSARHLAERGASFWPELVIAAGTADERLLLAALWDLVWAGEVTNDTLAPLRAFVRGRLREDPDHAARDIGRDPARSGGRGHRPAPAAGHSSPGSVQPAPATTERAHALARQLLDRHGVVTREAVLAEGVPGGFVGIYPVFRAMEEAGHVRRGYFVAGLGAAQFAHPGAVERLRAFRRPADDDDEEDGGPLVLAAADPAQPYGAALPWPGSEGRPARQAGAYVVLADGAPAAYLERGARSLVTFGVEPSEWVDALASLVKDGRLKRIQLGRIDGQEASDAPRRRRPPGRGVRRRLPRTHAPRMTPPRDREGFSARGERWAVATPHPYASEAAAGAFASGGNAVDAALHAAVTLAVVYPHMCGVGGDLFALVQNPDGKLVAIDSSGRAPAGADAEGLRAANGTTMPDAGPQTITVPGAVGGWDAVHRQGAVLPWRRSVRSRDRGRRELPPLP